MSLIKVCARKDFSRGRYLAVVGEGEEKRSIALFEIGDRIYAISNVCAHMGGPLIDGEIDKDGYVVCPWHGYQYDPKTGQGPAGFEDCVPRFDVVVRGDEVFVETEAKGAAKSSAHAPITWQSPTASPADTAWMCIVCRAAYTGGLPPETCAKCLAPWQLIRERDEATKLFTPEELARPTYAMQDKHVAAYLAKTIAAGELVDRRLAMYRLLAEQKPIDVLVISGSAHPQHIVSGVIAPAIIRRVEQTDPALVVEWIDLSKYDIRHNWACYSMADDDCRFPCNNMEDDMRGLYPKLMRAKSLMVATPINWEGMNSRLKVFLDRLTNLQDIPLKVGQIDCAGRPVGIFVNGHEDGAYKVAWDVFVHFQNMGYVLAPFGIWYNLSSLSANTNRDLVQLRGNTLAMERLDKVVDNVVAFMKLRVDQQLAFQPEGEKLRRVSYVAM